MGKKSLLPDELKIEILLGLSIKSLLRFKSVCKDWHILIESATFANRYSDISHAKNSNKLICFHRNPDQVDVVSLIDRQTVEKIIDLEWPPFVDEGIDNKEEYERFINILGPVNGIYCIFSRLLYRWVGTLTLWNPTTREYKHIAPPVSFPFSFDLFSESWYDHWYYERTYARGLHIGFGFDKKVNDFKAVVICHWQAFYLGYENWHVKMYNLSSDSWRTLYYIKSDEAVLFEGMDPFFHLYSFPDYVHCYLKGVFHWSTQEHEILGFNMTTESFELIKGPPVTKYEYNCKSAWVLNEKIAMVFTPLEDNMHPCGAVVWIMMEYGMEESWTMLHSIGPVLGLTIIGIPNDHQIFFSNQNGQLLSFDFEDQVFKDSDIYGLRKPDLNFPYYCGSQGVLKYVETFVPLKHVH